MEVLNSIERKRWIMLRIANKESVLDRVILRMDVLKIWLQQSAVTPATVFLPSEKPYLVNVGQHADFHFRFAGFRLLELLLAKSDCHKKAVRKQ